MVVLAGAAVLGFGAFGRLLSEGFSDPSAGSTKAKAVLEQKFGGEPNIIFLVHARQGSVDSAAVTSDGERLTAALQHDHRLTGVTSYWPAKAPTLRSENGTDALILARVADDNADAILHDYKHVDTANATLRIGGDKGTDVGGQVGKDLAIAESIAVPITLILLLIAFGSAVAALLPLGIALIAILATFAELSALTHVTDISIFAINLTTALGLGLGIDYALLMVSRFREELAAGHDVAAAVARTTATAGRTIAFSALTVAAALSAMLVFPVYFLKSFAYAGVGVTLFAAAQRAHRASRSARRARPSGELRPHPRREPGAQPERSLLGTPRDVGHAPAADRRRAGDRRAAVLRRAAAARHVRHAGRSGAAQEHRHPPGRRRHPRTTSPPSPT